MLLSICIPTYNFGRFIGETLVSILKQINNRNDIEIVVVDGNSQDNTFELMQNFCASYPNIIRYFREPSKGGIDRDMALSIAYAKGEYCWLFSGDDIMLPDSLGKIIQELKEDRDVYLTNFKLYNLDLTKKVYDIYPMSSLDQNKLIDFSNTAERHTYFSHAKQTCALFSFMSNLILKKSRWDSRNENPQFMGSCWAHVARLFELIPQGLKMKYLAEPYLIKRAENDSFMDQGMAHRIAIGVEGWLKLADNYFGPNSFEHLTICQILKNEFNIKMFLSSYCISAVEEKKRLLKLVDKVHGFSLLTRFLFLFPPSFWRMIRKIYFLLKGNK